MEHGKTGIEKTRDVGTGPRGEWWNEWHDLRPAVTSGKVPSRGQEKKDGTHAGNWTPVEAKVRPHIGRDTESPTVWRELHYR